MRLLVWRVLNKTFFFFEIVRQGVTKRKLADELSDLCFIVSQTDDQ